jgi:hypothetical protein
MTARRSRSWPITFDVLARLKTAAALHEVGVLVRMVARKRLLLDPLKRLLIPRDRCGVWLRRHG